LLVLGAAAGGVIESPARKPDPVGFLFGTLKNPNRFDFITLFMGILPYQIEVFPHEIVGFFLAGLQVMGVIWLALWGQRDIHGETPTANPCAPEADIGDLRGFGSLLE
jgi:hypothetical protein